MIDQDRKAFSALLADVLGFYGRPVTPFGVGVWWQACLPFELAAVRAAMTAHATDPDRGHFAPMPADVIRHLRGTSTEAAVSAWSRLLDEVRRVGSYGRPEIDAESRKALDDVGGWGAICRAQEGELPFLAKRFADSFGAHTRGAAREAIGAAVIVEMAKLGRSAA